MKRYEYVELENERPFDLMDEYVVHDTQTLNEWGADGWELVVATLVDKDDFTRWYYLMKRELRESDK